MVLKRFGRLIIKLTVMYTHRMSGLKGIEQKRATLSRPFLGFFDDLAL